MTVSEILQNLNNLSEQYTSALEAIEGSASKLVDVYGERVKALSAAAEVLELVAWAEDTNVMVDRGEGLWSAWWEGGPQAYGKTLIDTLRRAKEASRG